MCWSTRSSSQQLQTEPVAGGGTGGVGYVTGIVLCPVGCAGGLLLRVAAVFLHLQRAAIRPDPAHGGLPPHRLYPAREVHQLCSGKVHKMLEAQHELPRFVVVYAEYLEDSRCNM